MLQIGHIVRIKGGKVEYEIEYFGENNQVLLSEMNSNICSTLIWVDKNILIVV